MKLTKENVKKVLKTLGSSHAEIAKALKRRKIRGDRSEASSCPIAEFLKGKFPGEDVEVDDDVRVDGIEFRTPACVCKFVRRFDDGMYPELDNDPMEDEDEL